MTNPAQGRAIAVFYEHPEWFQPMFTEFERRGLPYVRWLAHEHWHDPTAPLDDIGLVVNRMSPSAYTRGHGRAIHYTLQFLSYVESSGVPVVNGLGPAQLEFSKARQIRLLHELGLRHPRSRVITSPEQAPEAAQGLNFPVVIKPNVGGSGAGIVRFDSMEELQRTAGSTPIDLGYDHTGLVQEYLPARGDSIVRVEVLDGELLYAIRLHLTPGEFNLCPADYCKPNSLTSDANADGVSGRGVPVEGYDPPSSVVEQVLRITDAADIDVGGVEYLVNDRDGELYYYDINALSNFVADAPNVVGFDPFPELVDYLEQRACERQPVAG